MQNLNGKGVESPSAMDFYDRSLTLAAPLFNCQRAIKSGYRNRVHGSGRFAAAKDLAYQSKIYALPTLGAKVHDSCENGTP
ncbi:MAG: hypothetical protein Q7T18_04270, partial [Sedimentisphaerales bacterium]|nr:hypothetical protein [Sedimentisphaerales bacterium]